MTTKMMEALGLRSSTIREEALDRQHKLKEYSKLRKTTQKYALRRTASKQIKLNRQAIDGSSKSSHKSGKLAPTDDCRVAIGATAAKTGATIKTTAPKKRKPPCCGRCRETGHMAAQCVEPKYDGDGVAQPAKNKSGDRGVTSDDIANFFRKK